MIDAAEREHLRSVFGGGDVADMLAVGADGGGLGADMPVGVDFHLHAAIAEDAFGDDGYRVDAFELAGDDEGGGLVVRIGRAGADAGDEDLGARDRVAVPMRLVGEEGDHLAAAIRRAFGEDQRIRADEPSVRIGVAVAGTGAAWPDAAQDGAGIAANDAFAAFAGAEYFGAV